MAGYEMSPVERLIHAIGSHALGVRSLADVERLLAEGVDPNGVTTTGKTPMVFTVQHGSADALEALIAAGAHVDKPTRGGTTPLMWASHAGAPAAITVLLDAGADVHHENDDGDTAMHEAFTSGALEAARTLAAAGGRLDAVNRLRRRPIDVVSARVTPSACPPVPRYRPKPLRAGRRRHVRR
jgi:ankyrin repeat protein